MVVWPAVDGDEGGVVIAARWGVGCGVEGGGDGVGGSGGGCQSGDGGGGWRVVASGIWDRIDRVTRSIFGARRKSFSATAAVVVVAGGWPAGGRLWW
nr:hypothetical protein [Tanacetum cinerariifolium]